MERIKVGFRLLVISQWLLASSVVFGAGLQTNFGFVMVENLQPGKSYNIRELTGLPMDLFNNGTEKVEIKIDIQQPTTTQEVGMVNAGFEPIPDTKWIKLSENLFTINPGQKVFSDIIITIPDDDRYLGKKFQVNLWSHMINVQFLAAALRSKLRFTISDRRFTTDQLKEWDKATSKLKNLNFSLLPTKIELEKVAVGRVVDFGKEYKLVLKLINPSDETFRYSLKSITVQKSKMGSYEGFEDTPEPSYLSFSESEFDVEADSIKKIKLYMKFPKDKSLKGKKFLFIASAEVLGQPVSFEIYSRILVSLEE